MHEPIDVYATLLRNNRAVFCQLIFKGLQKSLKDEGINTFLFFSKQTLFSNCNFPLLANKTV